MKKFLPFLFCLFLSAQIAQAAVMATGVPLGNGNGNIAGPGSSTDGFLPQWSGATGTALATGLPVGLTGNSTVVKTTSGGLLTPSIIPASQAWAPSTPAISTATFTPDFSASNNFNVVLVHAACPCTLANPTSPTAGQFGVIAIAQSSTGSDTIGTWGSQYSYVGGTASITLSTGASAIDYFPYYVKDSTHIILEPIVKGPTH